MSSDEGLEEVTIEVTSLNRASIGPPPPPKAAFASSVRSPLKGRPTSENSPGSAASPPSQAFPLNSARARAQSRRPSLLQKLGGTARHMTGQSVRKKSVALGFLGNLVAVLEQQTSQQQMLITQDKKLNEVIDEILVTEATYLEDLTFTVPGRSRWGRYRRGELTRAGAWRRWTSCSDPSRRCWTHGRTTRSSPTWSSCASFTSS